MKNQFNKWHLEETTTLYSFEWYFNKRQKKGAISGETAAFLYGFGEYINDTLDITVPKGYNNISLVKEYVNKNTNTNEKYYFQLETYEFNGMIFNIYSPERTLIEIIKSAKDKFNDVIVQTVKNFFKNIKYNWDRLIEAAKFFNVEKELNIIKAFV